MFFLLLLVKNWWLQESSLDYQWGGLLVKAMNCLPGDMNAMDCVPSDMGSIAAENYMSCWTSKTASSQNCSIAQKKQSNFAANCIEAVTQGSTQKIDNLMSSFVCWKTRWSCTISWRKTMFHSTALSFLLLCSVQTSHGLLSSTSVLLVTFCFTVVM